MLHEGSTKTAAKGVVNVHTVEQFFNETIAKYSCFTAAAALLTVEMASLTPTQIQTRCAALTSLQQEMTDTSHQLCFIMESMGPKILDIAYTGALQRAIDKSVLVCAPLQAEMIVYRNALPGVS